MLRLADHLKVKGIRGLALALGANENKVYGWIKNGNIGDTGIILSKYPNINRNWLLTGEGDMFTAELHVVQEDPPLYFPSEIHRLTCEEILTLNANQLLDVLVDIRLLKRETK